MSNPEVHDAQARNDIITKLDENFFVEAGAGSGKTRSLILRLVNLTLRGGVDLSHVAAITFTEAAAAELKQRLRQALEEIVREGKLLGLNYKNDPNDYVDYSSYREQAKAALEALPGAPIGTLHAFCLRIIRQFPLEAGVPPEVHAVSELMGQSATNEWVAESERIINGVVEGDEACIEAIDELLTPGYGEEFREALILLLEQGVKSSTFRDALDWLDSFWGELEATKTKAIMEPVPGLQISDLEGALRTFELFIDACENPEDKYLTQVLQPNVEAIRQTIEANEGIDGPLPLPTLASKTNVGSKDSWPGEIKVKTVKSEGKRIVGELEQIASAPFIRATTIVRRVLVYLVEAQARRRRQTGALEFHDMLYIAEELVQNPYVREQLHKQYTHILVDEFQDTDPIQNRVVTAIAGNGGEPVPGSLFTVGDPKQSIYRFRRADIATYLETRPTQGDERLRELTMNFRSAPVIIDVINAWFDELFSNHQKQDEGTAPIPFTPLDPYRTQQGHALLISHREDDQASLPQQPNSTGVNPDYNQVENDDIVAAIRELQHGSWGDLKLSDVSILAPTRRVAKRVLKALRKEGIEVKKEKTYGLFQTWEVTDIVAILRAIADPADKFAQVVALRTPLLGCSDEDLAAYRLLQLEHDVKTDNPEDSQDAGVHRVVSAQKSLKSWRIKAPRLSVGEFIARVIADTKLLQHLAELKWFDSINSVRAFQELAYSYDDELHGTLREFVTWVDSEAEEDSEFTEPVLDIGSDAVTLMTIHNSKGRQFPVVIVPGMSAGNNNKHNWQYFNRETGVAEFKFSSDIETSDYDAVCGIEGLEKKNEELRMQYVAMTRAEEALIVPLGMTLRSDNNPNGRYKGAPYLTAAIDNDSVPLTTREAAFPNAEEKFRQENPSKDANVQKSDVTEIESTFEKMNEILEDKAKRLPRIAASRIAHSDTQDKKSEELTTAQLSEGALVRTALFEGSPINAATIEPVGGYPIDSSGTSFGTEVHEAMEAVFENDDLDSVCETVASTYQLPDKELESLKAAVQSLAQSEVFKRAREASSAWTELPIIGATEIEEKSETGTNARKIAIDGVIDLLYKEADGTYVIADYKTDALADANDVASYFGQLYVYSKLLPVPVSRLELVFAREGRAQVKTLDLT